MSVKWGQHFLVDKRVAEKEIKYADIKEDDVVLEIGSGKGVLTELLAEKAKKVIAIEIDRKLVEYLTKKLPSNVEIICADILKVDLSKFQFNKIVSNIPFEISSPLTLKLLDKPSFSKGVMIYQKEFARRLVASPGTKDYSRITVAVYYRAVVRILETISKYAFRPVPKVDGAIVEIIPREKPPFHIENEIFFDDFLKKCFSERRKMLGKVIRKHYGVMIDETVGMRRIEELSPDEIGEVCNRVYLEIRKRKAVP